MGYATFGEVLGFAVGREKAAVAFYQELSGIAAFAAQRSTLAEFIAMEKGHAAMLESMRTRGTVNLSASTAVDLGAARRMEAEDRPTAGMTFQDILDAAISKETRSYELYGRLAQEAGNPGIRETFERLAGEESRHRAYFQDLYEREVARDN
ncbi:MAG: ferritin family protein [Treponema sp.]|nr:ferritin family protein [Treponema sp.]